MSTNRRFNFFWNLVKFLVAVILVRYVLSRTNLNEFLALKEQIIVPYLVITILLYVTLTLFKAFKYQVLLQQDTQYLRVLNVVVLQNAISNFLANSAGIASYLTMMKVEENVKLGRAGLVFLITKIADLFSVWFVMLICGTLYWNNIAPLHHGFVLAEGLIGIGLFLFFGAVFFRTSFINIFSRLMNRFSLTRFSFVQQSVQGFEAFAQMDPKNVVQIILTAFGLSFLYHLITLMWMISSMYTFDFHAEPWIIVFVSGILQLFSMIPINILGGIGITEATALYFYPLFGIDHDGLSPILLGWRVLYYITNLVVLIYLPIYTLFIERRIQPKQ